MTISGPSIGVAVPTYQRPELLRLLLASIPADVRVAVSDNGNSLSTVFKQEHPKVVFKGTTSVVPMFTNWNNAVRAQHTDWICLPSDDDLYFPGAFETAQKWISANPTADMAIFGHHLIDGEGRIFETWNPPHSLAKAPAGFSIFKYGVLTRMPSVFFRRELFEKLGGFRESLKLTAADSDFVQRATLIGNTVYVPEVISGYRVWNGGLTANRIATSQWMDEIDQWCSSVAAFDAEHGCQMYSRHLRDEIYLQNLTVGVTVLREKADRMACLKHLAAQRFPTRARARSYLHLLRELLRPQVTSLPK